MKARYVDHCSPIRDTAVTQTALSVRPHLREVVKVQDGHFRADRHPVDFIMETVQQEAEKFLSILLAVEGDIFTWFYWCARLQVDFKRRRKTHLQPTNFGAHLWTWFLNSEGLMGSLFAEVHRLWVSFANSEVDKLQKSDHYLNLVGN